MRGGDSYGGAEATGPLRPLGGGVVGEVSEDVPGEGVGVVRGRVERLELADGLEHTAAHFQSAERSSLPQQESFCHICFHPGSQTRQELPLHLHNAQL